jgi:hypothetical protein
VTLLTLTTLNSEDLKNATERQAHDSKISKPDGQAGRRSGYRLELAMGLEPDHFLRIQVRII